ncbi:hypothetical protein GCM10011317_49370 [Niveispirillum cyanobacteriorum]|nr:hypothetical protein GCM10011317_49370 [Niveispirillum cyanobacteriorum]
MEPARADAEALVLAGGAVDTLRLLKIVARIIELKTRLRLHLPTACTVQPVLAMVLTRTTRLVT